MAIFGINQTPLFSPGLVLWLDGNLPLNAAQPADNTALSSCYDYSGSGNSGTQATGASQPLSKTNVLDNKSIIRFDGVNDNFACPTTLNLFDTFTFQFAVKKSPSAGSGYIFQKGTGPAAIVFNDGSKTISLDKPGSGVIGAVSYSDNTWYIFTFAKSGASLVIRRNLVDVTPAFTNRTLTSSADNMTIGSNSIETANFLIGDLAELLCYNTYLSSAQILANEQYLGNKWGIA
jgi:hypothetical protein